MAGIYNVKLDGNCIKHLHPHGGQKDMEWPDVMQVLHILQIDGHIKRGSTIEIYCELED